MWFPSLSSLWRSRSEHRAARRKPATTRLTVEALEDRTALSTVTNVTELIEAINTANTNGVPDTIELVAGRTYSLTSGGLQATEAVAPTPALTIVGNGATIERRSGGQTPAFGLFYVAAGASLKLENLTLQGGFSGAGGGIHNGGILSLNGVTVQGCKAQGVDGADGGGVGYALSGYPGGSAAGGGVYSTGNLSMEDCTVKNNSAIGGRGGNGKGWYTLNDIGPGYYKVRASDGQGGDAFGGGICIAGGTATIRGTTVTANTAQGGASASVPGQGLGGGIYRAVSVELDAFTVANVKKNTASTSGDNIY